MKGFSAAIIPLGDVLGGWIIEPLVFFLVLSGLLGATAGGPGVLGGPVGAVISFGLHALWGASAAVFALMQWLGLFVLLLGLLGVLRRRARWYVPLLGIGAVLGSGALDSLRSLAAEWLGSASPWDAAPFWSTLAASFVSVGSRMPIWVREIWIWSNSGERRTAPASYPKRIQLLYSVLMGDDDRGGMGKNIVQLIDVTMLFGLCLLGWSFAGVLGVIIALVAVATIWGLARALVWLAGGAVISLLVVLPLSALLAIWEPFIQDAVPEAAGRENPATWATESN